MAEPRHANIEFANGEWRVWRTFASLPAAMAAVARLCEVEESAFQPEPPAKQASPPIVPHNIAAELIRDRVLTTDEDMGAPGEPPRCKTGVCDE